MDYVMTTLDRMGDRPLRGLLARLGRGETGCGGKYQCDWTRGLTVTIYRRKSGGYVLHWLRWSRWQGESSTDSARLAERPEDVLSLLTEDEQNGRLRGAAAEAFAAACESDPDLAPFAYESV